MSSRAEEAALKAYPVRTYRKDQGEPEYSSDYNANDRYRFQEGYSQAEKDLALTWEDILIIHEKIRAVYDIAIMAEMDSKQIYEEVLRRFNKAKEEEK